MNTFTCEDKINYLKYKLKGPLNTTLRAKSKNKTHKLFNNFNKERNLTTLTVLKEDNEETIELINKIKYVKSDIQLPVAVISVVYNFLEKNILSNSIRGTFISPKNKNKYFNNIGRKIGFGGRNGYFLRKGAGKKLIEYVLDDLRIRGIKTVFIHPLNKDLENYYKSMGFISILNVPYNIENNRRYYGRGSDGNIMYIEL